MSYEDDNFIILEDQNGHYNNNNSPSSSHRNISPTNGRRDRNRSRSRSYDDRRRSGGSNGHRSRSPRRSRSPHSRERDRNYRRSPMRSSGSSRSTAQLDRELGLKYRWEKTVYVSNIPYDTRWTDLKDLFRDKVGDIMYCEVFEKDSKSLGVAAIEFKTVEDAERAVQIMHQYELGGRKISCRIDNEGYKTRQAKEMSLEGHHHSSSKQSSSGNDSSSSQATAASTLALAQTLASLTGAATGGLNSNANLLSLLGLGTASPIVQQPASSGLLGTFGGSNPSASQTTLLNQLAAQLKVDGPVTNRIFIASLDYKVDEGKIKEVFALAGNVQSVSLFKDREGKSRGMAVVEYDTPFEALNAVSMFNNQQLLDRQMTVRFDTKPPRDDEPVSKNSSSSKLPSGLKSIGTGIGLAGLLGGTNNLGLSGIGGLGQSNDLSALSSLGLNLNGTAPSLMTNLLGSNNSSGLLGLSNLNGSRSSNGNNSISKIFVKNIPFSWDERKLKEKFRQAGHIEYVEIKVKDGKSRGCGLIRFSNSDQANKAVELFNGSRFEGRTLEVKLDQIP